MRYCPQCNALFEDADVCPHDGAALRELGAAEPEDPLLGQLIDGRFRIVSLLGAGGMGNVYRAVQTSTGREVALKVLKDQLGTQGAQRFLREAQVTSSLRNVHTVMLFDFGLAAGGIHFLAMELLQGESLEDRLLKTGAMPWMRALKIISQVAESLCEAHSKEIIHRDLKPANIFLTRMGDEEDFVKVLDFGIAKMRVGGKTLNLTGTGMVLGTPCYMAPEQARGARVDPRTDLYALGVVLYELLAGRPPFMSDNALSLMVQHCSNPVPPLSQFQPRAVFPGGVSELVERLLAKDPDDRISSAEEVRSETLALLGAGTSAMSSLALQQAAAVRLEPRQDDAAAGSSGDGDQVGSSPAAGAGHAAAPALPDGGQRKKRVAPPTELLTANQLAQLYEQDFAGVVSGVGPGRTSPVGERYVETAENPSLPAAPAARGGGGLFVLAVALAVLALAALGLLVATMLGFELPLPA